MYDHLIAHIRHWVDSEKESILDFTRLLVETPTFNTPPTGMEVNGQILLRDLLSDCGWQTELYSPDEVPGLQEHTAYWPGRNYNNRPNLIATFGNDRGESQRRILFNGHMDVVPAGYAPGPDGIWHLPTRPASRYELGRLYGPGAADMKGGLAAMLAAARCLAALGLEPPGQILLESVVDEEYGGANGSLAGRLRGPQAGLAIIAEPTHMEVCPAALCGVNYLVTLRLAFSDIPGTVPGLEGNSAFWLGEFSHRLFEYDAWRLANRLVPGLYAGKPRPGLSISWVNAGFPPPAGLDRVPETCKLAFGIEDYPEITLTQLRQEIQQHVIDPLLSTCPRLEIEMAFGTRFLEGVCDFPKPRILSKVQAVVKRVTGAPVQIAGMAASCDIFMFNHYSSTQALVFGPRGGGAHTANEWVDFTSVLELAQIFAALMLSWDSEDE